MPPETGATHNRSQTLSPPTYNDDIEAASQQLLAENRPTERQTEAVRGANFLNAARALPRLPATAGKTGKLGKPGKLKRVSLPEERQMNVRGAAVYDLDPSPQKRRSLPAQVAMVQVSEKENGSLVDEMEDMVPETSQVQPEDEQEVDIPASNNTPAADQDVEGEVSGTSRQTQPPAATKKPRGRPPKRKSVESAASARPSNAGSVEMQEGVDLSLTGNETGQMNRGEPEQGPAVNVKQTTKAPVAKKRKILRGPKFQDPEAADPEDDVMAPAALELPGARPQGDPQPEVRIPIRSTRLRAAQAEAENAKDSSATALITDVSGHVNKPTSQSSQATGSSKPATKPTKRKIRLEEATPEDATVGLEKDGGENVAAALGDAEEQGQELEEANSEHDEVEERTEDGKQADDEDADQATQQTSIPHSARLSGLKKAFQFTASEERPGVCTTNLGRKIHRTCDRSRVTLSQSGELPTMDDIVKCKDDLTTLLAAAQSTVREERRLAFKRDAFGYLFRSLTLVLKAMHDKLQVKEGDIIESLRAMQIIYPFVRDMLLFKGAIDAWKVKVPQREQGDRLIKDVESGLIVPLRVAEKYLQKRLGQLERAEQNRQVRLNTQREREEQTKEVEALGLLRERRRRWQDLHVVRMQCEPDAARRRKLRFVDPVQTVETDANGNQFERVPFLGERSMPPPRLAAISNGREWTQEQETVLLDALQSSTALEKTFKQHCRPGGALRDFTVSEFAAKMAWVRSGWAQLSQQHGWEIPEWVKRIPVLP